MGTHTRPRCTRGVRERTDASVRQKTFEIVIEIYTHIHAYNIHTLRVHALGCACIYMVYTCVFTHTDARVCVRVLSYIIYARTRIMYTHTHDGCGGLAPNDETRTPF